MTPMRYGKSRCTRQSCAHQSARIFTNSCRFVKIRGRSGSADIELLLGVIVIITVLLLVRSSFKLAIARLDTSETALYEAQHNATGDSPPQYTDDGSLPPVGGFVDVRPGLPNRTHV